MEKKFTHLHLHSDYSDHDGVCHIPSLVKRAEDLKFEYLSITDHGTLSGAIKFYEECKKHSVKPIIGVEAYICNDLTNKSSENNRTSHLILIAKNNDGYQNLLKLSHIASKKGFYKKPRLDLSTLEKHKNGLIILSGCMIGELSYNILHNLDNLKSSVDIADKYKSIFGEDYYLELMLQGYTEGGISSETERVHKDQCKIIIELLKISKLLNIKTVITNDVHYVCIDDMVARNMKMKIRSMGGGDKEFTSSSYEKVNSINDSLHYHLKSQEDMYTFWPEGYHESLYNTYEISKQCEIKIDLLTLGNNVEIKLPKVEIPKNNVEFNDFLKTYTNLNDSEESDTDEVKFVKYLALKELENKNLHRKEEYLKRLQRELGVVSCNPVFCQDFLIVRDYVDFAKKNNIMTGVGRGSAAGSLILYLLGITGIDPVKFNLNFDRFLSADEELYTSEKDYI